jgi:hypothetical protein
MYLESNMLHAVLIIWLLFQNSVIIMMQEEVLKTKKKEMAHPMLGAKIIEDN